MATLEVGGAFDEARIDEIVSGGWRQTMNILMITSGL